MRHRLAIGIALGFVATLAMGAATSYRIANPIIPSNGDQGLTGDLTVSGQIAVGDRIEAVAGDTRGINAADLQFYRDNTNMVAAAPASGLFAGENNRIITSDVTQAPYQFSYGEATVIVGGIDNTADLDANDGSGPVTIVGSVDCQIETTETGVAYVDGIYSCEACQIGPAAQAYNLIAGGFDNDITGVDDTKFIQFNLIAGGQQHDIGGATMGAQHQYNTIIGGRNGTGLNTGGSMIYGTIVGGQDNTVSANYTYAFGRQCTASADGAMCFSDGTDSAKTNSTANSMLLDFDGGVRVAGAGHTTYTDAQTHSDYAQMYHHDESDTGSGQACGIGAQDTWYELDGQTAGDLRTWTYATGDLTAGTNAAGQYLIGLAVSFSGGTGTNTYEFGISLNNSVEDKCHIERKTATTNVGAAAATCLLTIADGDVIKFEAQNLTNATYPAGDCTVWDSSVTLVRI